MEKPGRAALSFGIGFSLLWTGCSSFDTSYTDAAEVERSLWGGTYQTEPEAFPFLPLQSDAERLRGLSHSCKPKSFNTQFPGRLNCGGSR